jgi:hypothetical protein
MRALPTAVLFEAARHRQDLDVIGRTPRTEHRGGSRRPVIGAPATTGSAAANRDHASSRFAPVWFVVEPHEPHRIEVSTDPCGLNVDVIRQRLGSNRGGLLGRPGRCLPARRITVQGLRTTDAVEQQAKTFGFSLIQRVDSGGRQNIGSRGAETQDKSGVLTRNAHRRNRENS